MLEYAQAIRGDWSDFDGRSEKGIIESWVSEMDLPEESHTPAWWRDELNLCPDGNGHWVGFIYGHCSVTECPVSAEREGENE